MFTLLVLGSLISSGLCMPGGYSEVTDAGSVKTYTDMLKESETNGLLTLDPYTVKKIETQVVAGVNVKYTLEKADGTTCHLVIFDQVWTNTREVHGNTCAQKSARQLGGGLAGGYSVVTDKQALADYTAMLTTVQSSTQLDMTEYTVQKIETQVVAGLNVKYTLTKADGTTCQLVIFDQAWSNTREVHHNTCAQKSARQLGGGVLAGGYSVVTDKQKLADYEAMLAKLQSSAQLGLTQYSIQKVETQVVAGINIKYTLLVNGHTCEIVVFDQSWTNTRQVTHNTCPRHARRQLLGGYNDVDTNNQQVQQCLAMSVDEVNKQSNSLFRMVDAGVVSAKQQVVAGMNYEVTFKVAQSSCYNNADMMGKMATDCPVDANSVMAQTTWTAHCFRSLGDQLSVTNVQMSKEPVTTDLQLDNDLNLRLKPKASTKSNVANVNNVMVGKVKDTIMMGKGLLNAADRPVVSLLRKRRDVNFLIEKLDNAFGNPEDLNDIMEKGKAMLGGGDDHDLVNHVKDLIGKDGHDMLKHGGSILGGDGVDLVNHVAKVLGGDDHDMVDHGKIILGGDDHDMIEHGKKLIGGDDHDMIEHGKKLIGGDDHDMIEHGKKLIGGDDHDMIDHGKKLLGGDDHDMIEHGKKILGGDDHDMVDHGKKLIGGDDHDMVDHGKKLIGGDDHDLVQHGSDIKSRIIGGDGHDYCHRGMFMEFKAKFNKLYGNEKEEEKRYTTFCDNMRTARKLQETERGSAIYGATKFADLTEEEFKQYVGKKWDITANHGMKKAAIPRVSAPESFDWREHGAVTPVKNQGSCGSCWAFSTTGNIEGQWAIQKKKLVSLSEQELVDCDKVDEGCNGGLPSQAYKEIERLGGLETETDYSYKGEDEKCHFNKKDVKVYINDSLSISSDEAEMASWLAANGPISIGINAFAMQFYMGGISHPWKIFCNPSSLDHGVLIVGYGVQDSEPYWIVKNSWGPDWGEKGYYLVYRGAGVCGLNTMCTSAVVN